MIPEKIYIAMKQRPRRFLVKMASFITTSKLQLNFRRTIIENLLKSSWKDVVQIKTKKKKNTSWLKGGAKMWNWPVQHLCATIKNQEKYLLCGGSLREARGPKPIPCSPAQGFSVDKRNPHNFWLWKPSEIMAELNGGLL